MCEDAGRKASFMGASNGNSCIVGDRMSSSNCAVNGGRGNGLDINGDLVEGAGVLGVHIHGAEWRLNRFVAQLSTLWPERLMLLPPQLALRLRERL